MRTVLASLCAVGLIGCGWSETKFINEYAETDCEFKLECLDEAVLTFQGWETLDDCIADQGPIVTGWGVGCTYNKRAAKPCVQGIEEMTCPLDGEDPEYPVLCGEVFRDCAGDTDTGGGDTSDSGM